MLKVPTGLSDLSPIQPINSTLANIFPARVKLSILDNKTYPELFNKFGEWNSIGCIFFDRIDMPNPNNEISTNSFARPLFPNQSSIPVNNEIIYIISLPSSNIQSNVDSITYYYFQPVNIWNNVNHNAIPDPIKGDNLPESQKQDYQQTEIGVVRRVTDKGTEIDLGKTFKEKLNVKNLQPYEGDIIHQGRWGQSIRFGSTVTNAEITNTWSEEGSDGDPITIIRNGQHLDSNENWVPQVEDINKDVSSIYVTSTQKLPIKVSSKDYKSYKTQPISPNQYSESQIILSSGRLLFNSKTDSILLSSAKTINLNSKESVNIDSEETVVNSKKVLLGGKHASESTILGDKFLNDLSKLLMNMAIFCDSVATGVGPIIPTVIAPATQTSVHSRAMLSKLNSYKSKITKTK